MTQGYSEVVETARTYYNSEDADNFYFHVWGGEDIHIGLYESRADAIAEASRRTVERMASCIKTLGPGTGVLDLGSGYGGAARFLAKAFGCNVTALNLSERENERNRAMSQEQGVGALVDVKEGSFESVPAADGSFDVVWSQDAILHSGERDRVISEAARVLRPGGELVFTDPMQADDCPEAVLQPVYDRIHLSSLGSVGFYRAAAARHGLEEVEFVDLTPNLILHYARVGEELERARSNLGGLVSETYIDRMLTGLRNWVEAGEKGYLAWGILHFRKPTS